MIDRELKPGLAMDRDICCINFRGLLATIRDNYGEEGVKQVVQDLVDDENYLVADKFDPDKLTPVSLTHLTDPVYWVSNEFSLKLLGNVRKVVREKDPLFRAGEESIRRYLSWSNLFMTRLWSPKFLARQSSRLNAKFNNTKTVRLIGSSRRSVSFELKYRPGFRVTKDVCDWNRGIYSGIAKVAGATNVVCEETACVVDGGATACIFQLEWTKLSLFKTLVRMFLKPFIYDLWQDYEVTIKERDKLIHHLKESEGRYRTLVQSSLTGVYMCKDGVFIYVNHRLAQMLGYPVKDIIGAPVVRFMPPTGEANVERVMYLDALEASGPVSAEIHLSDRNGRALWLEVMSTRLTHKGQQAILGNVVDITDRKALESQLMQAQKMEAIGALAGGIAHDFNNILAAIVGYSEIIKLRFNEPALRGYLEQILTSCDRAKSLVSQILTFSRAAEHKKKAIDVASHIEDALKLLRATLPSTITFRQRITPGKYTILADPTQIHQVLINLCTNAAYAMREKGGVLEVNLGNLEVTPNSMTSNLDVPPGLYAMFTVTDNGTGIAPEIMHRIFDPFFTTKMTGEGTGLGLSVVYGIVRACGGTVAAQSKPGVGSVFSVCLPVVPDTAEDAMDHAGPVPGGKERILFVDDEEILVEMSKEMIDTLGYQTTGAADSRTALELFRSRPDHFDLVITDMTMPHMTGLELSKEIRKLRPDIPIILCTGFNELISEEKARALGIQGFAMKPLNLRHIAELIRTSLGKK
jgi:PAS domain S-box-containing protein